MYLQQMNANGELPAVFEKPKTYKAEKSVLGRSVELDGLSLSGNTLLVLECQFRKVKFDRAMLDHLKESVSIFPEKYIREYYLFSKSGFTDEMRTKKEEHVHLFELNDLFAAK